MLVPRGVAVRRVEGRRCINHGSRRRTGIAAWAIPYCVPMLVAFASIGCDRSPRPVAISKAAAPTEVKPLGATKSSAPQPETAALFTDVTPSTGIRFTFRDGQEAGHYSILESLGGGVAIWDYDRDGSLDVFLPGGGQFGPNNEIRGLPGALFRSDGACKFEDVTTLAAVQQAPYYSHGVAVGDYDVDGFPDLLITGYGGLLLFHNRGDGTFEEVAQASGLTDSLWSSSAAWGDLNGDAILDLYVAHYVNWSFDNNPVCRTGQEGQRDVCPPKKFEGLPDVLYYGVGEGTFRDASREAGLEPDGALGKGLGVLLADVEPDGDLDVYVANDTVPNFLYRNQGDGQFDEVGWQSGTALSDMGNPDGSMGVDLGDINLDGRPDVWVTNYERESAALYRNEGDCQFLHVSSLTGVTAVGTRYVGFGTLFLDFDHDGDEDLFVSNGHVIRHAPGSIIQQPPFLLENRDSRLVDVTKRAGDCLSVPHLGRGVAGGDLDHDGDTDLVLSSINEPTTVLLNESTDENQWLRVRLIGVESHRDAVGARLALTTSAGRQTRQVKGGGSYLSQSDLACSFGIPADAQIENLIINWPSGQTQEITDLATNREVTVIEGALPLH